MRVFNELRKRKVLQTAAVYFAVAWGATEVLSYLIERIPIFPAWADTAIAILFVLGFPVTVFLAWMFDVGDGGVRRADPTTGLGKGVIVLSVAGLLVTTAALSYLIWPRVQAEHGLLRAGDFGTVAVLPFENLTGDPSLGYLGVGLAEDIRQRLLAQTDLRIIGRVSIAGFGGARTDLAAIRGLLDAGLVLEGSLQNIAGQFQVSVALLDTQSGKQLWGNTFGADKAGWDPLRQRIVTSLAEQLALTVRVTKTENPVPSEALDAFLHGLAELNEPKIADGWFDQAVRLAPEFADAWARKALLRVDMVWRDMPRDQAWAEAAPFLARARAIEPDNLLADIAEASLQWVANLDPGASYDVLQRTEARAPNHPLVLGGLSSALGFIPGRKEDSETYARRYVAQDALSPDAHNRLGLALMFNQKLDEALQANRRALELDPQFSRAWDYRMNWQFFRSRQAEALATASRRVQRQSATRNVTQACMLYMAGDLLPLERAEPMLKATIESGTGIFPKGWWCWGGLETLIVRLASTGRFEEARELATRFDGQQIWSWPGSEVFARIPLAEHDGEAQLSILRELVGEETVDMISGPNPTFNYFNFWIANYVARALLDAGRVEEAQRIALRAAPIALEYSGPKGNPTATYIPINLLAISGDIGAALDYAEQVGPEGFSMFGRDFLTAGGEVPELAGEPRWQAFLERCRARWLEEVQKFDRMVASGEIVMPVPMPPPVEPAAIAAQGTGEG